MTEAPKSDTVEAEFARRLAGNEKKSRDRALKKLKQFLNLRSGRTDGGFTRIEMLSIWKGLFYCMWMSDKPLVQEDLAKRISELMIGLPNTKTVMLFFDVFLETMHREWRGIDRLRMDKFYLLVRCMLEKGFKFLQSQEWDTGVVDWMLAILKNGPICPTNALMGMHYHMCDIYLEELAKVGKDSLSAEMVMKFLDPYCILITKAKNVDLVRSAADEVFQQLVENSKPALDLIAAEEEGLVDIRSHTQMQELDSSPITQLNIDYKALAERLFELASEKGVLARNRKKAFRLVEKFRELAEGRLPLVDVPDAEYSSEDEVQELEEHLTNEIISQSAKELQHKHEEKKAKRKMKRRAKKSEENEFSESLELQVLDDVESLENGNAKTESENQIHGNDDHENQIGDDDKSEEKLPKKKKKGKRKSLEVGQMVTVEPSVDISKKKKKKKAKSQSMVESELKSDGGKLDSITAIESTDEIVETTKNGCSPDTSIGEKVIENKSKKKKKDKSETAVIIGSALEGTEEEQSRIDSSTDMDSTVMEFTLKTEHKSKKEKPSKKTRKEQISKGMRENMPDIVQDVTEREKQSEVDVVGDTKDRFALLRQWLDTGSKPSEETNCSSDTETAEENVVLQESKGEVKRKKKKNKRRNAPEKIISSSVGEKEDLGGMEESKPKDGKSTKSTEIEFKKFATICKAKPQSINSSFVKFSAAKVSKIAENRHLAAVKRKNEQPIRAHSPKKVVFEMSKTQIQPFRKNDKAIACSPSPSNIAFDPRKTPDFGLLKRSKTVQKKRKSASDFF